MRIIWRKLLYLLCCKWGILKEPMLSSRSATRPMTFQTTSVWYSVDLQLPLLGDREGKAEKADHHPNKEGHNAVWKKALPQEEETPEEEA